jgi:hypothetical protein
MKDLTDGAAITIFVGRFGSGKTEVAINYALSLAGGPSSESVGSPASNPHMSNVILIDLDVVTPYFRSREMTKNMQARGVEVIAPSIIGQHLDTPAITPQILGAIQQTDLPVVLDVGGDQQGARALGQFSAAIRQRTYAMYFVINPYRPFTDNLPGLTSSVSEIEASARLRVTSLVSNPNLMGETTADQIAQGHATIEGFARELHLPIALVCLERRWIAEMGTEPFAQPTLVLDRHFVLPWE